MINPAFSLDSRIYIFQPSVTQNHKPHPTGQHANFSGCPRAGLAAAVLVGGRAGAGGVRAGAREIWSFSPGAMVVTTLPEGAAGGQGRGSCSPEQTQLVPEGNGNCCCKLAAASRVLRWDL